METISVTVTLTESLVDELDGVAEDRNRSRSYIVREAIDYHPQLDYEQ
jgi:predicted transcriptional regulator